LSELLDLARSVGFQDQCREDAVVLNKALESLTTTNNAFEGITEAAKSLPASDPQRTILQHALLGKDALYPWAKVLHAASHKGVVPALAVVKGSNRSALRLSEAEFKDVEAVFREQGRGVSFPGAGAKRFSDSGFGYPALKHRHQSGMSGMSGSTANTMIPLSTVSSLLQLQVAPTPAAHAAHMPRLASLSTPQGSQPPVFQPEGAQRAKVAAWKEMVQGRIPPPTVPGRMGPCKRCKLMGHWASDQVCPLLGVNLDLISQL
jgi:hypothetical protein